MKNSHYANYTYPPALPFLDSGTFIRVTTICYSAGAPQIQCAGQVLKRDVQRGNDIVMLGDAFSPVVNGVAETHDIQMTEGFLFGFIVSVINDANNKQSQVFAKAELYYGSQCVGLLLQGYVTSGSPLCYPYSELQQPLEGRGLLRVITSVGSRIPLQNSCFRVRYVNLTITTDATVCNRHVEFSSRTASGVTRCVYISPFLLQASNTYNVIAYYGTELPSSVIPPDGVYSTAIQQQISIPEFFVESNAGIYQENFNVSLLNSCAGDTISTFTTTLEQWLRLQ
jgi:hypothetical protein